MNETTLVYGTIFGIAIFMPIFFIGMVVHARTRRRYKGTPPPLEVDMEDIAPKAKPSAGVWTPEKAVEHYVNLEKQLRSWCLLLAVISVIDMGTMIMLYFSPELGPRLPVVVPGMLALFVAAAIGIYFRDPVLYGMLAVAQLLVGVPEIVAEGRLISWGVLFKAIGFLLLLSGFITTLKFQREFPEQINPLKAQFRSTLRKVLPQLALVLGVTSLVLLGLSWILPAVASTLVGPADISLLGSLSVQTAILGFASGISAWADKMERRFSTLAILSSGIVVALWISSAITRFANL